MNSEHRQLNIKRKIPPLERILNLFRKGMEESYFTVVAGPGYGKTQVASYFAESADCRLIWVSLNTLDRIPSTFWQRFVRSVSVDFPDLALKLEKMKFPTNFSEFSVFYKYFSQEIYSGKQALIIIDNYNLVNESEVARFFDLLVRAEIENLCIVVMSNNNKNLPRQNRNYMITAQDLTFTLDETQALFKMYDVVMAPRILQQMHDHAGGWPLALYLMVKHYRENPLIYDDFREVDLSAIYQLFEESFYKKYENSIKRSMIKLAMLNGFSIDLLPFITETETDAAQIRDFVLEFTFVSYDSVRKMYTFQPLYREFLLSKKALLAETEVNTLLETAGDWFHKNDYWQEAVTCFRRCGNFDKMEEALSVWPFDLATGNQIRFYLEQLELLSEQILNDHPFMKFIKAYIYVLLSELVKAQKLYFELEEYLLQNKNEKNNQLLGEVYLSLAQISILQTNTKFVSYYKKAGKLIEKSMYRSRKIPYVGNNSLIYLYAKKSKKTGILKTSGKAGELKKIEGAFMKAAPQRYHLLNTGGSGVEFLFAAEAAYHTGDFARASQMAYKTIYFSSEFEQHDIYCNAHIILLRLGIVHGDYNEAKSHVDAIEQYVNSKNDIWLYGLLDCIKAWFSIITGTLTHNAALISEGDFSNLISPPINSGRDLFIHAYYLFYSKQYLRLSTYLDFFKRFASKKGMWLGVLNSYIMQAICYYHMNQEKKALELFRTAYEMTYENNIIMPFIELGANIRGLLDYVKKTNDGLFDMDWINNIYQKASSYAKRVTSMGKESAKTDKENVNAKKFSLSKREEEILNCLAQGLTREEIANFYSISISTVKKHITNVYNKLGAVNRADAIYIATSNKLLV